MKRIALVVLALGLPALALLAVFGLRVGAAQEGELVFSSESVDLDRIPFDQPAPFRFEMRNVGGKPVTIAKPKITAVEGC